LITALQLAREDRSPDGVGDLDERRALVRWVHRKHGAVLHRLLALLGLLGIAVVLVGVGVALWRASFPYRTHRTMREWLRVGKGTPRRERPRLRWAWPHSRHVWVVAWRTPVKVTVEGFNQNRDVMDEQVNASTSYWFDRGLVWMEAGRARLPRKIDFARFAGSILPQRSSALEVMKR
jgi:hypothetical protein